MRSLLVLLALLAVVPVMATGQDWRRGGPPGRILPAPDYDGRLVFLRIRYEPSNPWNFSDGFPGWGHDYPTAEQNFTRILSELTLARVWTGGSRVLTLDDPDLFRYPIAYLSEPGDWTLNDEELEALRQYLGKGGFIIFDDFPGRAWSSFERIMNRVIPGVEFVRLTAEHPVFKSFFGIEPGELQRGDRRGPGPVYLGVFEDNDPSGRLIAIANYNGDIGESWQYAATGFRVVDETNVAFKLGVNYWLYALTH